MKFSRLFCLTFLYGISLQGMQAEVHAEESQIMVSATGTVSVKPDMAEFGVVVKSVEKTAEQAAARTADKYRDVQRSLRQAGISAEDAPTASYTVTPQWEWDQSRTKHVPKGYAARHLIMVKVRNLQMTGKAVDAVTQAGADEVQPITFFSSRYEELRRQALAAAVANARGDAEIMARAAGGRLGGVMELSVSQPAYGSFSMDARTMKAAAPEAAPTEIAPSEQDIVVQVNTRWRFLGSTAK